MAARWFQASKDGRSLRFVPRFVPLEDRCVPATYYVDPRLAGNTDGATVTFDAGHANPTPGLLFAGSSKAALAHPTYTAFASLRAALDAAEANADAADTVLLATGTIPLDNAAVTLDLGVGVGFVNSVPVTQALTLRGDGAGATVVAPTADTQFDDGSGVVADEFTSVFRVNGPTASLTASGFRLDASAHKAGAGFAVQAGAGASFDGVSVTGVAFEPGGASSGTAIVGNAAKSLTFARGTVSGYGRTGLLFLATPGSVTDSTVVGRGAGAFVNNGVELQSGAAVSVTGNRVADNAGVASPTELSSGLLVTDDGAGGNPSKALAVGNLFERNGVALNVGAATPDGSTLDAAYNTVAGNGVGASGLMSLGVQNFANNWWGDASGPAPVGTGDALDGPAKLGVRPFLSYPTPQFSPADVSTFAAAQADYLRLITTLGVTVTPATATPSSVTFTVSFPVAVAANTVEPAALRPLQASDFVVTPPAGATVALTGSGVASTLTVSGLGGRGAVTVALPARAAIDPATGRRTAASNTVTVTVPAPPNAAPTVTPIADQFSGLAPRIGPLDFAVGDDATPAADLVVTATSSDDTVVPAAGVVFGGTGANRTVTLTNLPGKPGVSTITLSVADAQGLVTTRAFTVTVIEIAPPPPPPIPPVVPPVIVPVVPPVIVPVVPPVVVVPPVTVPPVVAPQRTRLFAVAADAGGSPEVQVFGADGKPTRRFLAFDAGFTGGVRVATADFDGDGTDDIVVAAGPGGGPHVRVVSGATGAELASLFAFDPGFRGGVAVAAADFTGSGTPSIVVAAGPGGGPHVKVVSLQSGVTQGFFAFDAAFAGGVTVAAADLDGDGRAEVVVGAGPGGGPHVKAFTFASGSPVVTRSYFAFDAGFRGGVFVAAGTFGVAAAQGVGGTNEVSILDGGKFTAYGAGFTGGVRLGAFDLDGDGGDELLTVAGPGGGPHVQAFTVAGTPAFSAFAFDKLDPTGYFIG